MANVSRHPKLQFMKSYPPIRPSLAPSRSRGGGSEELMKEQLDKKESRNRSYSTKRRAFHTSFPLEIISKVLTSIFHLWSPTILERPHGSWAISLDIGMMRRCKRPFCGPIVFVRTLKWPVDKLEPQLARSSNSALKVLFWQSLFGDEPHAEGLLRILAGSAMNYELYVDILEMTSNLEVASFDFADELSGASVPIIRPPRLRRLYISSQLFPTKPELPALEDIYMVESNPASFPLHDFCPTMQTLGVQILSGDKGNDLLQNSTVRNNTCIEPNVHSSALGIDGAKLNYGLFVSMVESRWRVSAQGGPCPRLRSVELLNVQDRCSLSTSREQRLDVLRCKGLRVSVFQGSATSAELMEWRV
ncbi:hypothetical protein B0H19DRAFT_1064276 [Mycena capillaripes]|nr:hypothetical protein B0H19DRAFT_1064276 [Mycena capillaripes]